jgi:hypothetical protein
MNLNSRWTIGHWNIEMINQKIVRAGFHPAKVARHDC